MRSLYIFTAVLSVAVTTATADDARPLTPDTTRSIEQNVIVLEPSDEPNPEPVVIGSQSRKPLSTEMPDFELTAHTGETLTKESLLGTPWVANFIFADCPTHCPMTLKETYDLHKRLADEDVRFVTFTVDPKNDTVDKLAQLADVFGADGEKWVFVTGSPGELQKVIRGGFREVMESNPMMLAHSLNMMQVDAGGKVVGRYRFKYQHPEGKDELNTLRQVLEGKIDIPEDNRFVVALNEDGETVRVDPVSAQGTDDTIDETANGEAPPWVESLRCTNAMLNGLATILLLAGLIAIKSGRRETHKRIMLSAFGTSVLFLISYLTYHGALKHFTGIGHKPYAGAESLQTLYRTILVTHVVLAAAVPVLAIITIYRGLKQHWEKHLKIAKVTFPIWLYVSVTGVIIYFMNAG